MLNMRIGTASTLCISLWILLGIGITPASAQTSAVLSDKLVWDQVASDVEAPQLSFVLLIDGVRTPLPSATCTRVDAQMLICRSPYPPMVPGLHELRVIAIRTNGDAISESVPSEPFRIDLYIGPGQPKNLRNERG